MKRIYSIFGSILFFLIPLWTSAQETWTLQRCIEEARDNSIRVRQGMVQTSQSDIDLKEARHDRLPNLSATGNYYINFGRTVDPTTYEFESQTFSSNRWSLNSNVTIFNGNRINNQIDQSQINRRASELDVDQTKDDIALQVVNAYLAVLFSRENVAIAERTLDNTKNQLEQLQKMIDAGTRPRNASLELEAQVARDEQSLITAENELERNRLNLLQIMRLPPTYDLEIQVPELNLSDLNLIPVDGDDLYDRALGTQPKVEASRLRLQSAKLGVDISQSALIPSLGIGGSLNSNYSSSRQIITGTETQTSEFPVTINGEPATLGLPQEVPIREKQDFLSQLEDNLSYGFGASLNIPIYDNYVRKANVQRARLSVIQQELILEETKQNLKQEVQQAVTDVRAAQKAFEAARKAAASATRAYRDAQKQFDIGATDSYALTQAQNNRQSAERNALIAKYDLALKLKVLDYYRGKPLTF